MSTALFSKEISSIKLKNDWNKLCQSIEKIRANYIGEELSENLLSYLIAAEDHRFWLHYGFDPVGLIRAFYQSKFRGSRQGGSTIAMQLVRTITGNYDLTFKRKLFEIILAVKLTHCFDKKDILKSYLSVAYFGWNMHGVDQACKEMKLNKSHVSNYDAALIIARLKYPEPRYYNSAKSKNIDLRASHILHRHKELNPEGKYGTI